MDAKNYVARCISDYLNDSGFNSKKWYAFMTGTYREAWFQKWGESDRMISEHVSVLSSQEEAEHGKTATRAANMQDF